MSSIAEARQIEAHPQGLDATGEFTPVLATGGVWRALEQLGAITYEELIAPFPVAEIPDVKPVFKSDVPYNDLSPRDRYTTTAKVGRRKVSVITEKDFVGALRDLSPHGFAPCSHAWAYLQNHLLRQHGGLGIGGCTCQVKAYKYDDQYGSARLAVNLASVEAMLNDPRRSRQVRGFTSRDSSIFSRWQDLVDLVAEPKH